MLKIFINPGHDMDLDPGACANGLREVDIALAIGQEVKKIMEGKAQADRGELKDGPSVMEKLRGKYGG